MVQRSIMLENLTSGYIDLYIYNNIRKFHVQQGYTTLNCFSYCGLYKYALLQLVSVPFIDLLLFLLWLKIPNFCILVC